MGNKVPNPGSDEAIAMGCICPPMDNAHGRGYMGVAGQFVIAGGCTLHWAAEKQHPAPAAGADTGGAGMTPQEHEQIIRNLVKRRGILSSGDGRSLLDWLDDDRARIAMLTAQRDAARVKADLLLFALEDHWLYAIECDHEAGTDTAVCACMKLPREPQPNVGMAVRRWIAHVAAQVQAPTATGDDGPAGGQA